MAAVTLPRLALTPGEPAGVGPDLALSLAGRELAADLVVFADPALLERRARLLGLTVALEVADRHSPGPHRVGRLKVRPVALARAETPGQLDPANAPYVLECLRLACQACQEREYHALVTGPVHKGVINQAGIVFSGHTEFLAAQTGAEQVVMMLATPGLRVALATTHLPLAAVSAAITAPLLERVIRTLHHDLRTRFGLARPRLLVCGLNPHAGEGGHLGREEIDIIIPLLQRLRAEGMELQGPLPADTAFTPLRLAQADAVLSMYHDQGLPVLKHLGFGQAVNISLGLPIVRTSVDHGTALDLAGSGQASPGSLHYAIETACAMARTEPDD